MKNNIVKKLIAVLLTVLLLSTAAASPFTAFAAEDSLQWQYISVVSFNLFFQYTQGSAIATVDLYDECIFTEGRMTVYESDGEGGWTRIATMIDDTLDVYFVMICDFEARYNVEYKAVFELTAHGQYTTESETFTDYHTCPSPSGRQIIM
ncbi:MAG: hypothetical protein IKJ75_04240 [Clostridia bacterium]|nr:hypothetical protein [Clostridia bacterium]